MSSRIRLVAIFIAVLIAAGGGWNLPRVAAQDEQGFTREILARGRIFPGIGPGIATLKRDSAGRYYILAEPATTIAIYGPNGQRAGQIPNANSKSAKITYAQDFDRDAAGRLFVADRGANAVKIFDPDGSLDGVIHVTAPTSVVALSGDEVAIAGLRSDGLVSIFDVHGKLVRNFGDLGSVDGAHSNRLVSRGQIYGDPMGHIYFVFADLPDPTVRNYDRFGYAAFEFSLPASEFAPQAEARNWTRVTIEKGGSVRTVKPVINALGVDPENQDIWIAIGDELVHYDKDGNRRATYRTATKEGAQIEPTALLIEHDRILIGSDPLGIFDFALPEPRRSGASPR
jgi:hypothetical protein